MTTGSILLAIALLLIIALFVLRPFLVPTPPNLLLSEKEALLAEKEALMARIRALDFDAQTAKQDEETYRAERAHLLEAAATVTVQIDEIGEDDIDEMIAREVAKLRVALQQPVTSQRDGLVETQSFNFCPQCGERVTEGDKFCSNCGRNLHA